MHYYLNGLKEKKAKNVMTN